MLTSSLTSLLSLYSSGIKFYVALKEDSALHTIGTVSHRKVWSFNFFFSRQISQRTYDQGLKWIMCELPVLNQRSPSTQLSSKTICWKGIIPFTPQHEGSNLESQTFGEQVGKGSGEHHSYWMKREEAERGWRTLGKQRGLLWEKWSLRLWYQASVVNLQHFFNKGRATS